DLPSPQPFPLPPFSGGPARRTVNLSAFYPLLKWGLMLEFSSWRPLYFPNGGIMLKFTTLIVLLAITPAVMASPFINVGTHNLQANAAGQTVQIYFTGGDLLQNVNLSVQIADGGPEPGGVIDGPSLSNVD